MVEPFLENANSYIKFMRKIKELGPSYVKNELFRMEKLIKSEKITGTKKVELAKKINILYSFQKRSFNIEETSSPEL
jgi:hypothetical protein